LIFMPLKRIALYGGTFDPIHLGHLAVAQTLVEQFALDGLVFIPAQVAPHKRAAQVTPAIHRYTMLALATQYDSRFCVSTTELDSPQRPYTIDTLATFQALFHGSARLFFVMGADSWSEITTWRAWERVLALVSHIVMGRPGYDWSPLQLPDDSRTKIIDLRGAEAERVQTEIGRDDGPKIYLSDAVMMDVSATALRAAVKDGRGTEWSTLVPPPVADYIGKYRLYREKHETELFYQGSGFTSGLEIEAATSESARTHGGR
jgi:nicotinate-nucleotide adenylyltransferase